MRPAVPLLLALACSLASHALADDAAWIDLSGSTLDAWKAPTGAWAVVGSVALNPKEPKHLAPEPGTGVICSDPPGRTLNLISKQDFGDVEVHLEFVVPKGSNSGIKLEGLYEVQIADSWGVAKPKAMDCGGIYPRAELLPRYRYLDQGYPPRTNASRPPGEWQTLDITFRAPRLDADGKKVSNARFVKVTLNGETVHEDVELAYPTGHAWRLKEVATGPILLQGDHGPVAFRNVRVRPLESKDQ